MFLDWCFGEAMLFQFVQMGFTHSSQLPTSRSAAPFNSLPSAGSTSFGNSRQLVGRTVSAGVLEVCRPYWPACEADYSCLEIGSETAWIVRLISFSGMEAVKLRVSFCLGWWRSLCSWGTWNGLYRHASSGLSGSLTGENRRCGEVLMVKRESGWGIGLREETVLLRLAPSFSALITNASTHSHQTTAKYNLTLICWCVINNRN